MTAFKKTLMAAAVIFATTSLSGQAATDAERIQSLENQLRQQRAVMQQQQPSC